VDIFILDVKQTGKHTLTNVKYKLTILVVH